MKRRGGGSLGKVALIMASMILLVAIVEAQTSGPGESVSPSPPESGYVVKKGDTLWGIAKSLLSDPFLWPQIWERNPFITNPNRIFPGDTLSVPGREGQAPVAQAPVPPVEAPPAEPPAEAPPTEAPKEAEAPAPTPPATAATPEITIAPIPPVPPASQTAIACTPVLLQEGAVEAAGVGSIVKSEDGRVMSSLTNTLYIGLDKDLIPQVGDRLTVIRQGIRAFHPWRKNVLGRALIPLGIIEVNEVRGRTVRASVIYSCAAMTVGDRVGPLVLTVFPEDKIAQPTSRDLQGFIVSEPYTIQ
ncbi:MAG TPA: LysM peptidoglycan-binding domain-containing protein, partial [Candidatus Acidoferrum sp.]|nr:LysM peptidoglycan-binding domain-containing protein [Candidatus Acidoferrum sp.]